MTPRRTTRTRAARARKQIITTKTTKLLGATRSLSALRKFSPPHLKDIYTRKRLFQLLHLSRERPAYWIVGPPGSGKTTLVASYLHHNHQRFLWYQVDAGDRDLASFFYHLGLCVMQASPHIRRSMPKLTPEYLAGISTFARNFFREVFNRLKTECVLVIDNLQEVAIDSQFYELLSVGISEMPPHLSAILISRSPPPPLLARLLVSGQLATLEWKALRLTPDEAIEFVRHLGGEYETLSTAMVERMYEQSDGWITGLILLIEGARTTPHEVALSPSNTQRVFDYFASEVFSRRHPVAQVFLMQTGLFPSFTVAMAEQLTRIPRTRNLIEDLVRHHLFISELPCGAEKTYQYHPLFRKFLMSRSLTEWTGVEMIRRQHRAASILERKGDWEPALDLYLAAGDTAAAQQLLLKHAPGLAATGLFKVLKTAIDKLSKRESLHDPHLLYWLGVSEMVLDPVLGQSHLVEAFERFQSENDPEGCWLAWASVVDALWQQQRDWTLLDPWIRYCEERWTRDGGFPSEEIAARVISSLFLALVWHMPDHPHIEQWAREAEKLWERCPEFTIRLRVGVGLHFYYVLTGAFARAHIIGETQHRLAARKDVSPDTAILANMISVFVTAYSGLYREATEYAHATLQLSTITGIHVFDCLVYGAALYPALAMEDLETADGLLANIKRTIETQPTNLDVAHYHVHCSWRARLVGENERAVQHAKMAVEIANQIGAYPPGLFCHYGLAHAYLSCGEVNAAQLEIDLIRRKGGKASFHWWAFLCELFECYIWFTLNKDDRGVEKLRQAFTLQERYGIGSHFPYWDKKMVALICAKAFEHSMATPYVRKLMRLYGLERMPAPLYLDTWPFPVKIYTFGRFVVRVMDRPLKFTTKTQKRPLELLKCMIALGGRDVTELKLSELLWPDADGDAAAQSLATTLHRLRRLIGEAAIERREGRLTINADYVWVDLWAFERELTKLEKACQESIYEDVVRHSERFVSVYRGNFLKDESEAPWALSARERLRGRSLRIIEVAAALVVEAARHDLAMALYQKGIEMDALVEGFYQGLMRCFLRDGRRAEALMTYQRCQKELNRCLGIGTSPVTDLLYRQILEQ